MITDDLHEYVEAEKAIGRAVRDNDQDALDEALAQQSKALCKMIDMNAALFAWRFFGVAMLLFVIASTFRR